MGLGLHIYLNPHPNSMEFEVCDDFYDITHGHWTVSLLQKYDAKKNYAIIWGTVSSKRIKLQSHTTSHFKDLEKTFPTIIRFLILINVKGE